MSAWFIGVLGWRSRSAGSWQKRMSRWPPMHARVGLVREKNLLRFHDAIRMHDDFGGVLTGG